LTRPVGETEPRDAAGGYGALVALLVLGLAFRIIIAYLLPGSGFQVDISSFQYWAGNLAGEGLHGFYERPFFHDYTPGYLYVLWVVGGVAQHFGGTVGDLIMFPPIVADLVLAWLVWSMTRELGGSERSARIGAFFVVVNPVTWFDSVLWGQVDSVGVVVLLLALRELWRDHPERAAALAMLAALIKPQYGILIPIVAVVTIRRALWPAGGHGDDRDVTPSGTAWERTTRGPIRIVTTAVTGLVTALAVSFPFGLSLVGLIAQIFNTAGGYPYLSVNAYNPWALVSQNGHGVALDTRWVCDSTVVPSGPLTIQIGGFNLGSWPASDLSCPNGFMIGAVPAVIVGMSLFLVAAAVALALIARRPDRRTMLVGLAVLSLAFFVLPTRVHERYLFPLIAVGAILAAVSLRWRIAYILSSLAMLANMYAVLAYLYPGNPQIEDWLGIGPALTSQTGIAAAALTQVVVLAWAFSQLRDDPLDDLATEISGGEDPWADDPVRLAPPPPSPIPPASPVDLVPGSASGAVPTAASSLAASGTPTAIYEPVWDDRETATDLGPWAWIRARFGDRPLRPDRSRSLHDEPGGRYDRLDLWIVVVLVLGLLTMRMWRLAEPYEMHFDEVYHPRTATEFLQDWRYGIPHDIYEWTHPHLAKYAMAVGLIAFGDDKVTATTKLDTTVVDADIEPRWQDAAHPDRVSGDRLWVVGSDAVRAYDLVSRKLVATLPVPGASSISVDTSGHEVFVGANQEIRVIDTAPLDELRAGIETGEVNARAFTEVDGQDGGIVKLHATRDGSALVLVMTKPVPETSIAIGEPARDTLIFLDVGSTTETGRAQLSGVTQIADRGSGTVAVAEAEGVAFFDTETGTKRSTVHLDGQVGGLAVTDNLADDPIFVSYLSSEGPKLAVMKGGASASDDPVLLTSFRLPGDRVGPVYFDHASRMVHAVGSVSGDSAWGNNTAGAPTVYVIEPHANPPAIYADAELPYEPVAIALDDAREYPSTDRQQLLALSADGQLASIPIGRHAWAWRIPGVLAGVLMAALIYLLARLLFRRRSVGVMAAVLVAADGMLFTQSRIGMNDAYVGLGIVAAYTLFAVLWLRTGDSRRHWLAFALGMLMVGVLLGLALASKWVAAYAIGGIGLLVLARSALGRVLLILGMVGLSGVLGYIAISVPEGQSGGNYLFLAIMVGLTLVAVVANVLHPVAWTWEEQRIAIGAPIAAGIAVLLWGLTTNQLDGAWKLGPIVTTRLQVGFLGVLGGALVFSLFVGAGRLGFGPMAGIPAPDDPARLLEAPAPAPRGWLNLGSGFGLPGLWTLACLGALPLVVYVISYIPWALNGTNQIVAVA
jgi:Gpi18-like mannosyltransferase/4-amino-4-deoxy-L-arabinose transferase-like glycosyltransferase